MGKKSPPPAPPDYVGAAEAQAEAGQELTQAQTWANRPNQVTPWGSTMWGAEAAVDPVTGDPVTQWTSTETLTPQLQEALDAQMALTGGRSGLASGMLERVGEEIGGPMDWEQFGDPTGLEFDPTQLRQRAEDAAYESSTRRLGPRFAENRQAMEIKLRNQGLRPGDQAYDTEMRRMDEQETDAYAAAQLQATGVGRAESGQLFQQQTGTANYANQLRQDAIREEMTARGFSLNEINALLTGQQVQNPAFQSFNTAGVSAPPQYLNAADMGFGAQMDVYGAQQAGQQGLMSGLGSLASGAMMMCDRRLKRDITRIGEFMGYPLYVFRYLWGTWAVGPMSDEVNSEAVFKHNGFDMIDLSKVV